jgi:putative phosphoribosyl transferase
VDESELLEDGNMTDVRVRVGANLAAGGFLDIPKNARGLVLFAHGSGSGRHSPRNRHVASRLNDAGIGTLLFDLLTPDEERIDQMTAELRFDIALLAQRLIAATQWATSVLEPSLPLGYFGASTGAAAALVAAAHLGHAIGAVVSRGGRPDLAGSFLPRVTAPTLLIVGGSDRVVIELNREAAALLHAHTETAIVPGAGHLFEEPGALDRVAELAAAWFVRFLSATSGQRLPRS